MSELFENLIGMIGPVASGFLALLLIVLLTPFAKVLRLVDEPTSRKRHLTPVPMVGGIAIYLAILATALVTEPPEKLEWLIAAGSLLVLVGFLDDVFELGIRIRFFAQLISTLIMLIGADLSISSLGLRWLEQDSLGFIGIILTIVAVVGLTNAFNMSDGIDGLAAGHSLICLLFIAAIMVFVNGQIWHLEWLMIFGSACLAFWLVNMAFTPLKRVFLGDAGSLYLGFIMAWMLIYFSQEPIARIEPVAALWCVAIPVWDTLIVSARRIKNGRSPFLSDRTHLHHILVDQGIEPRIAVFLILGLSVIVNTAGLLITYHTNPTLGLLVFIASILGFGLVMFRPGIEHRLSNCIKAIVKPITNEKE